MPGCKAPPGAETVHLTLPKVEAPPPDPESPFAHRVEVRLDRIGWEEMVGKRVDLVEAARGGTGPKPSLTGTVVNSWWGSASHSGSHVALDPGQPLFSDAVAAALAKVAKGIADRGRTTLADHQEPEASLGADGGHDYETARAVIELKDSHEQHCLAGVDQLETHRWPGQCPMFLAWSAHR